MFRFFRRRRVFLFRRSGGLCFFSIHHRIRGRSRGPAIGRDHRPITRTITRTTPGGGRGHGGIHLRPGRGWKLGLSGGTLRARRWHSFSLSFLLFFMTTKNDPKNNNKNGGFFLKKREEEEIFKVEKKRGKKFIQKSWSLSLFLKITKTTTTTMMMTMMVVVMMMMMMMMMTRFTTTTTPPTRPKA